MALGKGARVDITVVGEGTVAAVPDVMRLQAGVEVRRQTAAESFAGARAAASRLAEALRQAGIAERDLRTTELSLGPEYEAYPKVSAYRAAQGVEAVIRDLSRADEVIDTVARVGEEARLHGVVFEVSDPAAVLREARAAAFADARAKAAQYAELAGRPLGGVVAVSEEVERGPQPMRLAAAAEQGSVSPGQQGLTVTVRVVHAFGDQAS